MEKESNSLPEAKSNKWNWIIVAIVAFCVALVCCILLIVAGVFFLQPYWSNLTAAPELQITPTIQTSPAVTFEPTSPTATAVPTEPPSMDKLPILDYEADPLFGSVDLQRGFSPDPHIVDTEAGGTIDTSDFDLECGFVSSSPTYAFHLSGGASETFLRIFFATSDNTDTTLVVHTPNQGWLCVDNSSYGNGMDPVIDIEFAPSGDYAVWVGAWQSNTDGMGSLNITGSAEITP